MLNPLISLCVQHLGGQALDPRRGGCIARLFPIVVSATLARAVTHLLKNPATAERMGQAARRRARELFGFERQVDAYDGLYQRLAEEATHDGNT